MIPRSYPAAEPADEPPRWAEIWLACIMTVYGAALLGGGESVPQPGEAWLGRGAAGLTVIVLGTARLLALGCRRSRRRSPLVRLLGCTSGFLLHATLAAGSVLVGPLLSVGLVWGVLAIAELHASGRSARDVSNLDSLGIRRAREHHERLAAGT